MGNSPGSRPNLEEKLCGSCHDDYKCSLWKKDGRGKWWHIPRVARRGHAGCLKVLMQAGTAMDKYKHRSVYHEALEEAATWGRIACVKILVKAGADVNKMNVNGPLLVRAAGRGHTECVEFLLSKGADVNAVEYMGRTACHLAARHGHEDCLYLLIIAGADVNARNSHGHSPIIAAVKNRRSCYILELLIDAGADVNVKDFFGTPLIIMVMILYSNRVLHMLIDAGADVNAVDKKGNAPLIVASVGNIRAIKRVKLLLRSGARVNSFNNRKGVNKPPPEGITVDQDDDDTRSFTNMNALCHHIKKSKHWNKPPDRTMVLLLYAAGETLDGITIDEDENITGCVLDYLGKRGEICLKHLCREAIRKHLLHLDLHQSLFNRIPLLGLPKPLVQYLLYNMSL